MLKEFKCSELAELVQGKASSGNIVVDNISSLDSANASSISFLSDSSYIPKLKDTKSNVILIKKDDLKYWKKDYILVKNPYLAFSKIATLFSELGENNKHTIHESVVIGSNSKLEENNDIRAHTNIGDNCLLGNNIQIGSKYMKFLLNLPIVNQDLMWMLASYNAGPGNFNKWTKNKDYKYKDSLLLLESLPARETRNYIKLVLTNLWIYKIRFNQENDILLALASGKSIDFKVFFKK